MTVVKQDTLKFLQKRSQTHPHILLRAHGMEDRILLMQKLGHFPMN